jgi:peptide methionine sulfoxide reductase MsrA
MTLIARSHWLLIALPTSQPLARSAGANLQNPAYWTATFAGGYLWCMELPFDKPDGIISTTGRCIGDHDANPTYKEVSAGRTSHAGAIQIAYDAQPIS